jgi:hypothetical protein
MDIRIRLVACSLLELASCLLGGCLKNAGFNNIRKVL